MEHPSVRRSKNAKYQKNFFKFTSLNINKINLEIVGK